MIDLLLQCHTPSMTYPKPTGKSAKVVRWRPRVLVYLHENCARAARECRKRIINHSHLSYSLRVRASARSITNSVRQLVRPPYRLLYYGYNNQRILRNSSDRDIPRDCSTPLGNIWEFPKIGDPNIVPSMVGSLL